MLKRKGLQRRTPLKAGRKMLPRSTLRLSRPNDAALLALWGEVVRLRAGMKCEACIPIERACVNVRELLGGFVIGPPFMRHSGTPVLHGHHVYSRRFKSTRYDPDNGVCLCAGHHLWAHDQPVEFVRWWTSKVGESRVTCLRVILKAARKLDSQAVGLILTDERDRLREGSST